MNNNNLSKPNPLGLELQTTLSEKAQRVRNLFYPELLIEVEEWRMISYDYKPTVLMSALTTIWNEIYPNEIREIEKIGYRFTAIKSVNKKRIQVNFEEVIFNESKK
jgi:hypothetical protein